jgi:hypothetical protein
MDDLRDARVARDLGITTDSARLQREIAEAVEAGRRYIRDHDDDDDDEAREVIERLVAKLKLFEHGPPQRGNSNQLTLEGAGLLWARAVKGCRHDDGQRLALARARQNEILMTVTRRPCSNTELLEVLRLKDLGCGTATLSADLSALEGARLIAREARGRQGAKLWIATGGNQLACDSGPRSKRSTSASVTR